uniref:E3 ubiquitin-protein ligase RNF25 n=2 Tax=Nothobranchius pienaari TaxID=704102 RepID=A0A1A8LDA8_9TELE
MSHDVSFNVVVSLILTGCVKTVSALAAASSIIMTTEYDVQSEIEVLQSIYLDELKVDRRDEGSWEVSLVLYPSTAEVSVSQFVRLTLTLTLNQQYPSSSPVISIRNPRGLSDDILSSVQKCLQLEAESWLGSPVLYQLIEKAKEILTESNIPHGNCVICLYDFKEGEAFTKTSCYHYFHSHCLGRYASHSERELRQRKRELEEDKTRDKTDHQELTVLCPVCREPLMYDIDQLLSSPAPQLPELDEAAVGSDFQQKWRELQKLLEKQRSKGGIIDPEVESNRFLIRIHETPSVAENENLEVDVSPGLPGPPSSNKAGVQVEQVVPGLPQCGDTQGQRRQGQNHVRGPRRGGRSRPHQRRGAPIRVQLEKLCLSSDCAEEPIKTEAQGDQSRQVQLNPESHQSRSRMSREISAEQPERQVSPNHRAKHLSALEVECPKDGGNSAGSRGHRGRRRGPHRPGPHFRTPGPPHHYLDGRAPRGHGGANNLWGGEGGGGRPSRGHHSRGFHQQVVEQGREEVV